MSQRPPLQTHAPAHALLGAATTPEPPRILGRLPARLRGADLYALKAEDHYVRIHTSAGSDLVLLRFTDALLELDGVDGAQVHRSWWVARGAVTGSSRAAGKLTLQIADGAQAPVSRTYTDALRSGGWFDVR